MSGVSATLDPSPGRLPDPERSAVSRAPALRRFARGVRRRHIAQSVVAAVLRWGLLLALPWVLVAWWLPWYRSTLTTACLAALAGVSAYSAVRALWQSRRALHTFEHASLRDAAAKAKDGTEAAASPGATLVADELRTWAELDADARSVTASQRGMLHWLERDLHDRLGPEVRRALAQSARPTLGRWRWLVPVLLMLLLAWLLATLLAPWWDGALGGRADQPRAGGGSGSSQAGAGASDTSEGDGSEGDGSGDSQPDGPPEQGQPVDAPPSNPPQPDPAAGDEATPPEVPPLLEVDDDRHFVLPDFVGDGPTRRARMHVAEMERARLSGGSSAPSSGPQMAQARTESRQGGAAGGGAAGGGAAAPPPPPDFERAAERAVRSRHVPEAERGIVRRFFDRLRQRAKQVSAPAGDGQENAPEQKLEAKTGKTDKTGGGR
ncbi:MAG: hypothetical protein AB8H80_07655 [Planctomycetota bacterium]